MTIYDPNHLIMLFSLDFKTFQILHKLWFFSRSLWISLELKQFNSSPEPRQDTEFFLFIAIQLKYLYSLQWNLVTFFL